MRRCVYYCMRPQPLSFPAISRALLKLPEWRVDGNNSGIIHREFTFKDFSDAIKFMNAVAVECEAAGHHPTWENKYNKVSVRLTTHDAGNRVTQKDIDLALKMNEAFERTLTNN
ncbi:pterin-4-alpha-carbinolamine dehydratase, putative [Trypanosoma equiperdum]|nr:pterin-4-alpha-carbinolamine dehydratase, putative [Trypanosoma equiperdum]